MKRSCTLANLRLVAIVASILSFLIIQAYDLIFNVSPAFALQVEEGTQEMVLYAAPRRDTMKDESFIFYNKKTGDLWVYRNEKFKEHYMFRSMGQDLEKIKDQRIEQKLSTNLKLSSAKGKKQTIKFLKENSHKCWQAIIQVSNKNYSCGIFYSVKLLG